MHECNNLPAKEVPASDEVAGSSQKFMLDSDLPRLHPMFVLIREDPKGLTLLVTTKSYSFQ